MNTLSRILFFLSLLAASCDPQNVSAPVVTPSTSDAPDASATLRCGVDATLAGDCYVGSVRACQRMGENALTERSRNPTCQVVASSAFARACALSDGPSCWRLVDLRRSEGHSGATERARALSVDRAACTARGEAEACRRVQANISQ